MRSISGQKSPITSPLGQFPRPEPQPTLLFSFDDVGAPLICETVAHGPMVVGMFQKLGIPIDNRVDPQIRMQQREHCLLSREMYFNILTEDSSLIDFLDEFQIPSIATTYQACKFPSHPY